MALYSHEDPKEIVQQGVDQEALISFLRAELDAGWATLNDASKSPPVDETTRQFVRRRIRAILNVVRRMGELVSDASLRSLVGELADDLERAMKHLIQE